MAYIVREYCEKDLPVMIEIWNEIIREGVAFPQLEGLTLEEGRDFFAQQDFTGVAAEEESGELAGLYILHPNNVGRCGHICNASYAVFSSHRGQGIGEKLVSHCIRKGKELGFGVLQFNAVVANNTRALKLYKKLGFTRLGTIPKGFRMDDGHFEDIVVHYLEL